MDENIDVTIFGSPDDPRHELRVPGINIHYAPPPHPEDICVIDGIRVTSIARTLIDLSEEMSVSELRATFQRAREMGLLDIDAVRRCRARVEWRPSLAMVDQLIAEFD